MLCFIEEHFREMTFTIGLRDFLGLLGINFSIIKGCFDDQDFV